MIKRALIIISVFLSSACTKELVNSHDEYINNAPSELASLPTQSSEELNSILYSSLSAETVYIYNNDITKPIGKTVNTKTLDADLDPLQFLYIPSHALPDGYLELLKAYNEENAFEKRRIAEDIRELFSKIQVNSPFNMLEGKSALFDVEVDGSLPFDFESMSKTVFLPTEVCAESLTLGGDNYGSTYLAVNPLGELQGDKCLVNVRFADEGTAETFEEASNNNQLSAFVKATYVGYGSYMIRFAIGTELVFVKKNIKGKSTYTVDSEARFNAGKTYITDLYSYDYITSIKPINEFFTPENLMATMPPSSYVNYEANNNKFDEFLNYLNKSDAIYGHRYASFRIDEEGDIELALFHSNNSKLYGAVGKYRLVVAGTRQFALLKSQYQAGKVLPRVLVPESVSQQELVFTSLVGAPSHSVTYKKWNPEDLKIILAGFGYSEEKLKEVSTEIPYDVVKPISNIIN
ncbi:hypothetical protein AWH61_08135 [Alteromonas sp. W12]|uniref:hypothetical protein n=1 Tax=Alteromonas sp. W12 TaxID=1772289 RepID=UPI0009490442|nr:hypothetical protein [Alteromonas sp. W12]OLF76886.1 hypothetical protein AWH61_08135 [Alteromonas sp. W12]|tara:strand:+ start:3614 stop:5002 length:1389 start_codon:yes stop_codon:yes gene_type:complete